MKIALLGYGKMGKEIEKIALNRGHEILFRIDVDAHKVNISAADAAIDFSVPSAAANNIKHCIDHNIPVVSGTTGWLERYDEVADYCRQKIGTMLYASNFSLGVNMFFELNQYLAKVMAKFPDYTIDLEEIHHTQKLDAPSGTAISLANQILIETHLDSWKLSDENPSKNQLPITAKRIENVPGTHTVRYKSTVDDIQIKHTAHNRQGFALGAVLATEWLVGKQGVFSMKDVLEL